MTSPRFQPGFRMSLVDGVVLAVGTAATAIVWTTSPIVGFVIAYVLGHFFLFCNVFRVARVPELAWAAVFVVLAGSTIASELPGWPVTIVVSLAVTVVVVWLETRKPSYHGVAWQRVNPRLSEWWKEQHPE